MSTAQRGLTLACKATSSTVEKRQGFTTIAFEAFGAESSPNLELGAVLLEQ